MEAFVEWTEVRRGSAALIVEFAEEGPAGKGLAWR